MPEKAVLQSKCKSLASWRSWVRFVFRILLAIGFVVQSAKLLEMYMLYPSTVELRVEQPTEVELPAFTVCNVNEIRSTKYCEKYPQYCGLSNSEPFCANFAEYCNHINDSRELPLFQDKAFFRHLTRYEQQVLGHQYEDLVVQCTIEMDDEENDCPGAPLLVPALSFSYETPFNCFTMNSLQGKPDAKITKVPVSTKIKLTLNLEVSEYHPSHLSRGGQLSIHSPYHIPSPVGEGIFLNMGTIYRVYVKMADKILLPKPYKSNCTDYEKQWKLNGGTGPVTEKMCKEMCKLKTSLAEKKCVERRIDYPHNETICPEPDHDFAKDNRIRCASSCSSPCDIKRYELEVQEANSEGNRGSCVTAKDLSCFTLVHIIFENMERNVFTYKPLFEPIGLLSFIGGYVGLWLGISLLTVYDFLETRIFRLIAKLRKRKEKNKSTRQVSPLQKSGEPRRTSSRKKSIVLSLSNVQKGGVYSV